MELITCYKEEYKKDNVMLLYLFVLWREREMRIKTLSINTRHTWYRNYIITEYCPTWDNLADMFTKPIGKVKFVSILQQLNIVLEYSQYDNYPIII